MDQSRHMINYTLNDSENMVGKGENAAYQLFLLFPHCFLLFTRQGLTILAEINHTDVTALNLDNPSKILLSG